ncbi:hypothetical protein [Subtercola boreus]|uniref:hypothetical protein n=1 Tax=Subtercola boreus TaxID=120213 RepID=UPI0015591263|nr:hypothetical protein [Subtercola boreus]
MADFGEKAPDVAGQPDPEHDDGPTEAQKRKRLIASRVVVAGVGLTFLIVGFVQFVTK